MATVFGYDGSDWIVAVLLMLMAGLGVALFAATRGPAPARRPARTRVHRTPATGASFR